MECYGSTTKPHRGFPQAMNHCHCPIRSDGPAWKAHREEFQWIPSCLHRFYFAGIDFLKKEREKCIIFTQGRWIFQQLDKPWFAFISQYITKSGRGFVPAKKVGNPSDSLPSCHKHPKQHQKNQAFKFLLQKWMTDQENGVRRCDKSTNIDSTVFWFCVIL